MTITWNFAGGFSKLLDTAALKLALARPPADFSAEAAPLSLLRGGRQPIQLHFGVGRRWSVRLNPAGRWTVRPDGDVEALILPPQAAFLGNFRVAPAQVGIQWRVTGVVEGEGSFPRSPLCTLRARTRAVFTWIRLFDRPLPVGALLEAAWHDFVNPLDPQHVAAMHSDLFLQFSWSGSLSLGFSVPWSTSVVWSRGKALPAIGTTLQAGSGAQFKAAVTASRTGTYSLRWWRRQSQLRGTLTRERTDKLQTSFRLEAELAGRLDLKPRTHWLRPVVRDVEKVLAKALARRLAIALAASGSRWDSRRTVLRLTAKAAALRSDLETACRRLLEGQVPTGIPSVTVDSVLELVQGRESTIGIQLLDWTVERTASRQDRTRILQSPDGQIVIERGVEFRQIHRRWEEIQLFRLLWDSRAADDLDGVRWSFGLEGRTDRETLHQALRSALHAGAVDSYSLAPGATRWEGRLLWVTRFSPAALQSIFSTGSAQRGHALVKALETAEPKLYAEGSFRRDWIESAALRRLVERDPVAAPLRHRYPVPGRTDFQRQQVVADYRRVLAFLRLLEGPEPEAGPDQLEILRRGFRLPIFLFCHFLCPPEMRESALLLESGGERAIWGRRELL